MHQDRTIVLKQHVSDGLQMRFRELVLVELQFRGEGCWFASLFAADALECVFSVTFAWRC